ncbi:hypothetical protein BHE74_00009130 [Ensete ventricosum]|nr:hypothetical protein BHE74_00009130 [Ensete ventricosum]
MTLEVPDLTSVVEHRCPSKLGGSSRVAGDWGCICWGIGQGADCWDVVDCMSCGMCRTMACIIPCLDLVGKAEEGLDSNSRWPEIHRWYHWTGDLVSDELLPEDLVRGPLPRRIQDVSEDPGPRLRHPLQRRRRQQAHPPCRGLPFRMCVRPPKPTYPLRRPSSTGHPKILGPPNTPCPFAH